MNEKDTMRAVLSKYLSLLWSGNSHQSAVLAVAEEYADDPWVVVGQVGLLCRCVVAKAERPLGLNQFLQPRKSGGRASLVDIPKGALFPVPVHDGRKSTGSFDTPAFMARRVAAEALAAAEGAVHVGLDPACGTGALLLALCELGVPQIIGYDVDGLALEVAKIAVPGARFVRRDAFECRESADVVVGNPPFVSSERQKSDFRSALRRRYPWLEGRFDLSVPFSELAASCCRSGGGLGLILPHAVLVQRYGRPLRQRWLNQHHLKTIGAPESFPGASVEVSIVSMAVSRGPAPVPPMGLQPSSLLGLPLCPLGTPVTEDDIQLVQRIRQKSIQLGELCLVDTGVVAHMPGGSREALLHDLPAEGRVPYADAKQFFDGHNRWLAYRPERMHRSKVPSMFEQPKIVIQRIRGRKPLRGAVDRTGVYLGHTCTIVQPHKDDIDLESLLLLMKSPYLDGVMKIERGQTLDLYPREVASFPIPQRWLQSPDHSFESALSLNDDERARLGWWAAGGRES